MIVGFSGKLYKRYDGDGIDLIKEVVDEALDMAGLEYKDIDGVLSTFGRGGFLGNKSFISGSDQLSEYLGIRARYLDNIQYGGPSALTMIYRAYKAIRSGEANTVLCVQGGKISQFRDGLVTPQKTDFVDTAFDEFIKVYTQMSPISDYAMVAYRHSKLFGTTDEQRALVSVSQRYNAMSNEKAMFKTPLTVKDVLSSRIVSYPLHLLEIVYPVDGFHAFIVSKKTSKSSLRNVDILGYGEAHWSNPPPEWEDIIYTPAVESSKMASFNLNRVDVFELYDSFTITVMLQMEDIGLVEKGKVGKFVESNDLTYKGNIPLNTGGGSLNTGQPAYMSGGVILEEALLQLNGMAKGRQVKDVNTAFLNGIGWWSRRHSVTLVLGEKK
ncbi:thiolase family protein [Sulfolobus acidocaldarius]|uniref:Acetyl-CoA acetyltransferase n=4 Tax=Sulfolobus acidocaldarius TaxID=2285 RepID=Q4J817_SULAC|nr:thiolase family protein [Sulfolobus acidocaldarius]AAY81065.1 acetyl-CoA acetyltransferase [Sulfolobus acidocaldarius DSM 639]AGE71672.1 acetyl-CoA acetyltransferase [Sulfolobus acidocaldarius N8]AGE73945.1 acetyl-CoA acetyltransferase [Sulfolobus acidocaldarius Ron12/I]ALU30116.1 acetyl-CoA acetyltransferase [Sulfolobus acidocaldarius]ALU30810.1 acetyl-CoA acetyltransferase [Sulfolobus acidocaldarius]